MDDTLNLNDEQFVTQLEARARLKVQEYNDISREIQRLTRRQEDVKTYVEKLNDFLVAEGLQPIPLRDTQHKTGVGKPGNRSKALPLRRQRWEAMTIDYAITTILNESPNRAFDAKEISPIIYEIQSEKELKKIAENIRSSLQRGAQNGLWIRIDRGKYKAKIGVQQGVLSNT